MEREVKCNMEKERWQMEKKTPSSSLQSEAKKLSSWKDVKSKMEKGYINAETLRREERL
jgi:hypothetical protein